MIKITIGLSYGTQGLLYRLGLFICALWFPSSLWAQQQPADACGSDLPQQAYDQYRKEVQKERGSTHKSGQTTTLKLQPHIIRRSNGTGGLSVADLNTSIAQLNQAFVQVGFTFEACAPNYINDNDFYDEIALNLDSDSLEYQMALPNRVADAVNVFFVPNAVFLPGATASTNWSSFPYEEQTLNKNWTVMTNSFATDNETLAHEIGHYFNLIHTHGSFFNGQTLPQEHKERNPADPCYNCETTGDLLCDTEATPDLNNKVDSSCQYSSTVSDPCNQQFFQPDTRNLMSYALIDFRAIGCRIEFSPGQINRMWAALNQYRTNLSSSCSGCPTNVDVTQDVPSGQVSTVLASNRITASNSVLNGGTATYDAGMEIILTPNFDVAVGGNFDGIIGGCTLPPPSPLAPSDPTTTSPRAVEAAPAVHMTLAPNPATEQVELRFSLAAHRAWVTLSLMNAQGQIVQQSIQQNDLAKGPYNVGMNTRELPSGIYFVRLQTEKEQVVQRLVILKN